MKPKKLKIYNNRSKSWFNSWSKSKSFSSWFKSPSWFASWTRPKSFSWFKSMSWSKSYYSSKL